MVSSLEYIKLNFEITRNSTYVYVQQKLFYCPVFSIFLFTVIMARLHMLFAQNITRIDWAYGETHKS